MTPGEVARILVQAAARAGLDASTATPLRTGAHVIFELDGGIIPASGNPAAPTPPGAS